VERKTIDLLLHLENDRLSKERSQTAVLGLEGGEALLAMFNNTDDGLAEDSRSAVVDTIIESVRVAVEVAMELEKVIAVRTAQDWPWKGWSMPRIAQ
jgi:hypothetical protein